jgi:hypothetical protein
MARLSRDPDLFDPAALARARTLHDFDDAVTAPVHGFASATDYYTRSSSIHFLARIRRPTLLLSATDDPFLPRSVLRDVVELARSNPAIHMETHDHGGHVGFVGGRLPWHPDHYAERRLLEFLASHLSDSAVASARRRG